MSFPIPSAPLGDAAPVHSPGKARTRRVPARSMASIREHNHHLILEAASEVFAEKGYAGASTPEIAERAGVPKANLYYYFQSKENLYQRVLESVVEPFMQASELLREGDEPRVALAAYIRSKVRIAQERPRASRVFASELMHGASRLPGEHAEQLRTQVKRNIACLRSWIDRGLLAPVDPQHLLLCIWAAAQSHVHFGWQMSTITGVTAPTEADYEKVVATLTRLVLQGTLPG